MNKILASLDFK